MYFNGFLNMGETVDNSFIDAPSMDMEPPSSGITVSAGVPATGNLSVSTVGTSSAITVDAYKKCQASIDPSINYTIDPCIQYKGNAAPVPVRRPTLRVKKSSPKSKENPKAKPKAEVAPAATDGIVINKNILIGVGLGALALLLLRR